MTLFFSVSHVTNTYTPIVECTLKLTMLWHGHNIFLFNPRKWVLLQHLFPSLLTLSQVAQKCLPGLRKKRQLPKQETLRPLQWPQDVRELSPPSNNCFVGCAFFLFVSWTFISPQSKKKRINWRRRRIRHTRKPSDLSKGRRKSLAFGNFQLNDHLKVSLPFRNQAFLTKNKSCRMGWSWVGRWQQWWRRLHWGWGSRF